MSTIAQLLSSIPTELYINGQWQPADSGDTFTVENPATGETIATVASAGSTDAVAALDAAHAARTRWAATSPAQRAELLDLAYRRVMERSEDFATLMTLEMGKPLDQARGEVIYGANYLRWFAGEALRLGGESRLLPEGTLHLQTRRRPVGPSLLITPWNFPLAMATRKIAPALAAGCTVIIKPATYTPLTTLLFTRILEECMEDVFGDAQPGVVNIVPGARASQISAPLLQDPRLRKLSFTGSTPVGRTLLEQASHTVLRTSMELGGNAPFIVCDDADIPAAVAGAMAAKMRNIGEACTAANRFLVHASVVEEFTAQFTEAMQRQTVGDGLADGVDVGPLISAQAVDDIEAFVRDAQEHGGRILCGGSRPGGDGLAGGHFFSPTVISFADTADGGRESRCFREEIFGPIAPIFVFHTDEEAVALANETEYGLASYLFTSNHQRAQRLADQLEYGLIGYNTGVMSNAAAPFGGVKQSGMGREGGIEGITEYTEVQYMGYPA